MCTVQSKVQADKLEERSALETKLRREAWEQAHFEDKLMTAAEVGHMAAGAAPSEKPAMVVANPKGAGRALSRIATERAAHHASMITHCCDLQMLATVAENQNHVVTAADLPGRVTSRPNEAEAQDAQHTHKDKHAGRGSDSATFNVNEPSSEGGLSKGADGDQPELGDEEHGDTQEGRYATVVVPRRKVRSDTMLWFQLVNRSCACVNLQKRHVILYTAATEQIQPVLSTQLHVSQNADSNIVFYPYVRSQHAHTHAHMSCLPHLSGHCKPDPVPMMAS